jgi:hypothetical protein
VQVHIEGEQAEQALIILRSLVRGFVISEMEASFLPSHLSINTRSTEGLMCSSMVFRRYNGLSGTSNEAFRVNSDMTEFVQWLTGTHLCGCGAKYSVAVTDVSTGDVICGVPYAPARCREAS